MSEFVSECRCKGYNSCVRQERSEHLSKQTVYRTAPVSNKNKCFMDSAYGIKVSKSNEINILDFIYLL